MQTDNYIGKQTPIKWKIFGYLLVFVVFLLLLLWLLQVVFLDSIYKEIKTKQIFDGAKSISANIDHPELPALLESISKQHGICVRILDENGDDLYSVGDIPECLIGPSRSDEFLSFGDGRIRRRLSIFFYCHRRETR